MEIFPLFTDLFGTFDRIKAKLLYRSQTVTNAEYIASKLKAANNKKGKALISENYFQ